MSNIVTADPDAEVSAMCHKNHIERAYLYEQDDTVMDAKWVPVSQKARSGPMIYVLDGKSKAVPGDCHVALQSNAPCNDMENQGCKREWKVPTILQVKRILGAMGRWGAGVLFLCGVADGLIDTTYGLMLTIICAVWGLLHLIQGVARG